MLKEYINNCLEVYINHYRDHGASTDQIISEMNDYLVNEVRSGNFQLDFLNIMDRVVGFCHESQKL